MHESPLVTYYTQKRAPQAERGRIFGASPRGSHLVLKHPDGRMVVLPMHSREIPRGTLYAIVVHQAQLSVEEWNDL